MDGILKQYSLYVKKHAIDRELLEMSSKPIVFEALPSMTKNKYVYTNGGEILREQFLMFSDQSMLNDYFSTCGCEPFSVNVVFSDNIWDSYFEIRPDHKDRLTKPLPSFNGTVVAPVELDGTFTVILDNHYVLEECKNGRLSWIGTIIHETTHAVDYRKYARIVAAPNYDEILDTTRHRVFHLWTEFNARRHGYYFLRKYSFGDMADDSQVPFIMHTELPTQIKNMTTVYNSTSDGWEQIYAVSQFLGRLAVWEELFPSTFDRPFIEHLLGTNPWMLEMYDYLNTHRDISTAVDSLEELRNIVQINFKEHKQSI